MFRPLIRTFSMYCRQTFGCSVGKIPLDLGQPCPNRRSGGCIFCLPAAFTPACLVSGESILEQRTKGKKNLQQGGFKKYFAYLQQETCTAVEVDRLLPVLETLLSPQDCVGLILSTRPDCVSDGLLEPLAGMVRQTGKECLFELGVQTAHESSLKFLNRNHGFGDFVGTAARIEAFGCFSLGAHLILGIPGERWEDMLFSLKQVCASGVRHLKIHHLQVVRTTALAALYRQGAIEVFQKEEYLELLLRLLPHIPAEVTIHRLWATAHPDLLLAPKWHVRTGTLAEELQKRMAKRGIWQGQLAAPLPEP